MTHRATLATGALLAILLLVSAGCGGASEESSADGTLTTQTVPATGAPAFEGSPSVTVVNVVQACREKDAERLRSFIASAPGEVELQALFARGTDVRLLSQREPEVDGEVATVSLRLEVRRAAGELEVVDRTWALQRGADGLWRLTALPDCY